MEKTGIREPLNSPIPHPGPLDSAPGRDIVKCCGWARSGGVFLNHQSILENLSL